MARGKAAVQLPLGLKLFVKTEDGVEHAIDPSNIRIVIDVPKKAPPPKRSRSKKDAVTYFDV